MDPFDDDDIEVTPAAAVKKEGAVRPVSHQLNLARPRGSRPSHHEFNLDQLATFVYPTDMEPRDYQRNIIRKALVRNLVCALPTGLGKTFIASVVMLNWFLWTKSAKIVFVAPTRPLVTQQAESFLQITGISIKETAILLQEIQNKQNRINEWEQKRVFFATAQTVENDLRSGIVDPKSIVLLVLDEAHRATGNHSYVKVVEQIRKVNHSFRVLGLTATPSGYFQGVQDIVDILNLAAIEVRSENSLDIRPYVHNRQIDKVRVDLSPEINDLLYMLARATEEYFDVLRRAKITTASDVTEANEYVLRMETNKFMQSPSAQLNKGRMFQVRTVSAIMQSVCYSTRLLKTHGIAPFYERMHAAELEWLGSKGRNAQELVKSAEMKQILRQCRILIYGEDKGPTFPYTEQNRLIGFQGHPKLTELVNRIDRFMLEHSADSRIIVFAELRDSAAEIMWMLRNYNASVRPHLFVGQSSTNRQVKGMRQKEQQEVLAKFKSGEFNVLVATSIGEEGLDIGQVDLIICFDQSRSPIRNIQRMGRTGRKRQGSVIMLMTEQEEKKLAHAFEGHSYIRNRIMDSSGKNPRETMLTLKYHEADPIFPEGVEPQYTEIKVSVPQENEEALAHGDIIEAFKSLKPNFKRRRKTSQPKSNAELDNFGFVSGLKKRDEEKENEIIEID